MGTQNYGTENAVLAQRLERQTRNLEVVGSIPTDSMPLAGHGSEAHKGKGQSLGARKGHKMKAWRKSATKPSTSRERGNAQPRGRVPRGGGC